MKVDVLSDEEGRLCAMHRYGLPDAVSQEPLDRIVKIAQAGTNSPIAAVSIVERKRQSFLAIRGMPDTPLALDQSICAITIKDNRPLIIEDAQHDSDVAGYDLVSGSAGIRSYLGVPVVSADGYNLGTVCVMDTKSRRFTEQDVTILVNLARLAAAQLATRQPESYDFLTGAMTRRRFQLEVEREFERATRYERPASLLFLDVDDFREVNKRLGPGMADEVLKTVSNRCSEALRTTDSFGRIGGEEFAMLLPETLAYESSQCAERLREVISKLRFRSEAGVVAITASFGISPLNDTIKSATQWFAQADIALYAAKQSGQDCVAFAPPVDEAALPLRRTTTTATASPKVH